MPAWRSIAAAIVLGLSAVSAQPATGPAPAQARPVLKAVAAVRPGLWQLRMLEPVAKTPPRDICITDVRLLMQLRHGTAACGSFVIADEAKLATVQYSCPGAGWGRTSLRLESANQVRLDSQGIAENAPFAFIAEARRTGDCPQQQPAAPPATSAPR